MSLPPSWGLSLACPFVTISLHLAAFQFIKAGNTMQIPTPVLSWKPALIYYM